MLHSDVSVTEEVGPHGIALEGPSLALRAAKEMISEGVSLGAIQVTPSGQAIILFVEQQTTGGYPKIANVIGADLFCMGQLRPRDEIRFERVALTRPAQLWIEQQQRFEFPGEALRMKRIDLNCDMGEVAEAVGGRQPGSS